MISPLDVYLVAQLDAIKGVFLFCFTIVFSLSFYCATKAASFSKEEPDQWDTKKYQDSAQRKKDSVPVFINLAIKLLCASCFILLGFALIPSTRTAAAIILVPKLTSKEGMQPVGKEMGELYDLEKSALKRIADGDGKSDKRE